VDSPAGCFPRRRPRQGSGARGDGPCPRRRSGWRLKAGRADSGRWEVWAL